MVFLLTLPSVITICKVSIDGMRIQGRIVEKSKKVGSTFKKKRPNDLAMLFGDSHII